MGYGVNFRLDFCDVLGNKCRVDILKKDYTGLVIPFIGSGNAFSATYKNENEDKFNQITTSEATIGIIANENISLNTFYTEDERTWKVVYYKGEFIANNWDDTRLWNDYSNWEEYTPNDDGSEVEWDGFVMPDSSNEPFLSYPYEFQLKAKDILGTLKDIPYSDDGVLIKKVDSLKNILGECLRMTDLGLNFIIGVNTFPLGIDGSNPYACPLQETYIDTNRFIDTNNKPYSVFDVIKHICNLFTASLKQANGKWYFIDVTENVNDWFNAREYRDDATFSKVGPVVITTAKAVLPDQLVNKDHSFEKEPAYKTVSSYYQYGYLSNQLNNGDFNVINPAPLIDPFPGWTSNGGLQVGYGQKSVLTPDGNVPINDYYLFIYNNDYSKWLESDPITVLKTNTVALSLFFGFDFASGVQPILDGHRINFYLKLSSPGQTDMYWSNESNSWVDQFQSHSINFSLEYIDYLNGSTVNLNTSYPPYEGQLVIQLIGVCSDDYSIVSRAIVDDFKITLDESQYYKSPIGYVDQLVNVGNFSKSPDPTVLLFGDDGHRNRTSWMRTQNAGVFTPTVSWYRKADGTANALPLQRIVARNILSQYRKASRRFEGSIKGDFSPLDTLTIPLTDGKFCFVSGTFDARSATAKVVYSEIFTGEFTQFNESTFEDFGDFKNTTGSPVGSSSGVSLQKVSSQPDLTGYVKTTDLAEYMSANASDTEIESGTSNEALTVEQFRVSDSSTAPASATDTGTKGEMRVTADAIYVCIEENTWVKTPLTTF